MRKICIENLPAGLHAFGMQTGKSLILHMGSRYDPEHSGSLEPARWSRRADSPWSFHIQNAQRVILTRH